MNDVMKQKVKNFVMMTIGAVLYSAAIALLLDPNALAPGGVTGISIILSRLIPVETGTLILLINIPILILGTWKFGWKFIISILGRLQRICFWRRWQVVPF